MMADQENSMRASESDFKSLSIFPMVMIALAILTCINVVHADSHKAGDAPNIVLIISDDQAWGDYSFMGYPKQQQLRCPS